ncbi:DNA polymerase zeta catalytic subunit [Sparassis crispa]|uniref:DNA polymerase n=1 Tax=Sparassis crispa TaxID=139825 RepID=A0A401GF04_9APHY|nr:DNA polymerase zeta catalytic subunit [Sparassis crispa]GBE80756.1 DNA polymerase zeta catalytic subunit [Sparassis crispa]
MSTQDPSLRVRINQIDYTLALPGSLDNSTLPRVPIIRIYGESSKGRKACVHVHQVYPYFFVEYQGKMNPDSVNRYIARLTPSLNHAIAISMKRDPQSPKSQFIRAILLVKGVHFYGFHASYSPFLKVHIADPAFVTRAVTIMQSGTVMKTRFRVYESHLSYLLQFLCDFGLYGCGWIDLGEVWERGRQEIHDEQDNETECQEAINSFGVSPYFRQSRMSLEVDVAAHQILNRHLLTARNFHHKLTIPAPPSPEEPLVLSVRELWEDERRRRVVQGLSPSPEIPKDPSADSRGHGGEWVAEARWWEEIAKRIESERGTEKVLSSMGWERWIMTTFESVEALWERQWRAWRPGRSEEVAAVCVSDLSKNEEEENPYDSSRAEGSSQGAADQADVDVDETFLSSQAMSQLVENEEAEWAKIVGGNQENEDDIKDEDDVLEDGPPPDVQSVQQFDESVAQSLSPATERPDTATTISPSKRSNPFQAAGDVWRTPKRMRMTTTMCPSTPETGAPKPSHADDLFSPQVIDAATRSQQPCHNSRDPHTLGRHPLHGNRSQDVSTAFICIAEAFSRHDTNDELAEKARQPSQPPNTTSEDETRPSKKVHPSSVIVESSYSSEPSGSMQSSYEKPVSQAPDFAVLTLSDSCSTNGNNYVYSKSPPTTLQLLGSLDDHNLQSKVYRDPYYSLVSDTPERPREYAGLVFNLKGGDGLTILEDWVPDLDSPASEDAVASRQTTKLDPTGVTGWEYTGFPPSIKQVRRWLHGQENTQAVDTRVKQPSQIEGPTQMNPFGLKVTPVKPSDSVTRERRNMTVLSLEVFAPSQGHHLPDPGVDEVVAVFYSYQDADTDTNGNEAFSCQRGIIAVEHNQLNPRRLREFPLEIASNELDLLNRFVDIVGEIDPDIVVGWEVQAASWGYLSARGQSYGLDIGEQISRAPGRPIGGGSNQWGMRTASTFKVIGRHVLNLWRIIRAEQSFTSYTFENVVFNLLRRRTPRYSARTLTEWFNSAIPNHTASVLHYFSARTSMVLELLDAAEVVTKTAEFARVFGVDFFSVLSRGSQFKVESFMFRIAKPESFVLLSPSKQDVGKQNAAECMPLIMEPLSAFYNSPLVVLDFQSLYPSIMIAYNYCYSTCLGRVTDFKGQYKFGVTDLRQPAGFLDTLHDHINVSPNGIMYVKPSVRRGLLARMLTEILDTRVMVKQAMKRVKDDKALRRVLDARQLGLKFIANVTYGYTSATYSGRMPAVEIADSIVQSGRETLEKAIRVIDSTKKWGAKVVYGDTDSVFIYLRGKTKEQAFRIGHEMADTITAMNPVPVKLKFEKIYLPCVLMAKKRYVGFKFENPDDKEPVFDAKGIETVRRDGIPAQQKMTETCLKILFRTQDLSRVKEYCCRSWSRILENKISIQDFIFAKEVRMGTYSDKVPPPPGATVAARRMLEDPNDEPQYGDRIPYVIIRGEPNSRLVDRAVAPEELFDNSQKALDAAYYISRVLIPPLERIFNLVGADVRSWYDDMPKTLRADQLDPLLLSPRKAKPNVVASNAIKIDGHFQSSQCLLCGAPTLEGLCEACMSDPQTTVCGLESRIRATEDRLRNVQMVCSSCTGSAPAEPIKCESLDCPWLFERKKAESKADCLTAVRELAEELERDSCD